MNRRQHMIVHFLRYGAVLGSVVCCWGYQRAVERLPELSEFAVEHYFERAQVYGDYLTCIFLYLSPACILGAIACATMAPVRRLVSRGFILWMRLPSVVFWGVVPAIFFAANAWTAYEVIGAVPRVFDAFNYWFQAKNFSLGQLYASVPAVPEFFQFPFVIMRDGRWYGSVYPGFPIILAVGVAWGVEWLVNPVLGGISLSVLYFLTRRVLGQSAARAVAVLGLTSPFWRMMSSNFMSHAAGTLWVALALWAVWIWVEKGRNVRAWVPLLFGCTLGWLYMTRPQAGAVALFFPGIWAAVRIRWCGWRNLMLMFVPCVCAIMLLGMYNQSLTGDFRTNPRYFVDPGRRLGFGDDIGEPLASGRRSGHSWQKGVHNVAVLLNLWNAELVGWGAWGPVGWQTLLSLTFLIVRRRSSWTWVSLATLGLNFLLYLFYFTPSPHFGPRYLAETIPFSLLVSIAGLHDIYRLAVKWVGSEASRTGMVALTCFLIGVSITCTVPFHTVHYGVLPASMSRHAILEPMEPAVILIPKSLYTMNIWTWNSPNQDGNIYLPMGKPEAINRLRAAFPDRTFYVVKASDGPPENLKLIPMEGFNRVEGIVKGHNE
ncbi:glycosyltransferase family 39 protein [bacterium]|nr:glycosyltransferase family 39 protein [candidate division CSSED10-310 bacterium]